MDGIVQWVKDHRVRNTGGRWVLPTGGRWVLPRRVRKRYVHRNLYYHSQIKSLSQNPQARTRRLSASEGEQPIPRGRLLSLPAELRLMIWEYTFGGNCIALYRNEGRLVHTLLDESNSQEPARDFPVQPGTIKDALGLSRSKQLKHGDKLYRPSTLGVLAVLQSCRSM